MAVCQLFGHFHAVQHAFAADQFAGLFGSLTGAGSLRGLFKDHLGHGGVFQRFVKIGVERSSSAEIVFGSFS